MSVYCFRCLSVEREKSFREILQLKSLDRGSGVLFDRAGEGQVVEVGSEGEEFIRDWIGWRHLRKSEFKVSQIT